MKGGEDSKEVCILSQFWLPDIVGDSIRLGQLVTALRDLGWKVTLITTKPHYPDGDPKGYHFRFSQMRWEDGVKVVRVSVPKLPYAGFLNRTIMYGWFSLFASLYAPFVSRGPVIWAFSMKVFSTYAAMPAKFVRDPKLVSEVTDVWPEALVNTGYLAADSWTFSFVKRLATVAYRASDAVSTITTVMAAQIASEFSVAPGKVFVNPYVGRGLDGMPQVKESGFLLEYLGNLGANYDISALLGIAERLRPEGVRVVIRGDGERLEDVRNSIRERSLTNVDLISRVLSGPELEDLQRSADAFILPMTRARYEDASFPGKFVDYLFAGRPVIYIGGGLPASLIRENEAGLAVDSPDIETIARFVLGLRDDPATKIRLGENARRLAQADFSSPALRDSVAALLEKVLAG